MHKVCACGPTSGASPSFPFANPQPRGYGELLDRPYNGLAVGERSGERLP
jgi:hypothetical protein